MHGILEVNLAYLCFQFAHRLLAHFLYQLQKFVVATLVVAVGVLVTPDHPLRTEIEICFCLC